MNNEIKEILNNIEYVADIFKVHIKDGYKVAEEIPSNMAKELRLNNYSAKKLLDYITNLQQENERLKQDYINVRNYIKMRNVSAEVEDKALLYNIELENINKKKYLDYKSRCEKAIEYIDKHKKKMYKSRNKITMFILMKLENILQNGSDDNGFIK